MCQLHILGLQLTHSMDDKLWWLVCCFQCIERRWKFMEQQMRIDCVCHFLNRLYHMFLLMECCEAFPKLPSQFTGFPVCKSIRMTPGNKDTGNSGYSWVNCSSEKIVMIHLHRPTLFALTVALKGSWKEQTWVCESIHTTPGNKDTGNIDYLWDEIYSHLFTPVILNVMSIAMHTSYLYYWLTTFPPNVYVLSITPRPNIKSIKIKFRPIIGRGSLENFPDLCGAEQIA